MEVSCTFGLAGPFGNVSATAFTRVTGGFGGVRGTAIAVATLGGHWRFDSPLPYAQVYLSDVLPGGFTATTTAGASGQFEFTHVPAGLYDFGVVGFYHFAENRYPVYADSIASVAVYVVAYSGPTPTPPPSPSPPPAPQPAVVPVRLDTGGGTGTDTGALASTGADVAWPAITGLLALITGALLLLRRGRRTPER
jgi:LPXTG-motif cell wall-anchored protein